MAVLRWDPWGELANLQRDVNELFGRSFGAGTGAVTRGGSFVPPIDAFTTADALVVRMELPGMRPDDVDISVQDGVLTVSGERFADTDVKDDAWLRRERFVGQFERSFALPEGADPDAISAAFENGLLELRVPHPPGQQPRRVKSSAGSPARAPSASTCRRTSSPSAALGSFKRRWQKRARRGSQRPSTGDAAKASRPSTCFTKS